MDNQKAKSERVSGDARYGIDWTRLLAKSGLEAPGYHETVEKMKKEGRIGKNKTCR